MIHIRLFEPNSPEWRKWKNRCKNATMQLIKVVNNGGIPEIDDKLYKEQKEVFLKNFHNKCAYCETLITTNQPGDIDHFRPKGKVTDLNNKPILITGNNGKRIQHPGYYWLAFELSNLLPSCIDCNRPSRGNSNEKLVGKWNKFPVKGEYAFKPGDEAKENPLLINPLIDNPENHLEIDVLGVLHPKDERGEKSIEVFGLNDRLSLIEERKKTYNNVLNTICLMKINFFSKISTNINDDVQNYLNEFKAEFFKFKKKYNKGQEPYSIAGKKAISDCPII